MNVALIVRSDRLDRYLPQMRESLERYVHPAGGWSAEVHLDDSKHEWGMAGAVAEAWRRLPSDTDYVVDVEEDFVFVRDVPVELMCRTIEHNTHLAQLVLKRAPTTMEEVEAGGYFNVDADAYVEQSWWPPEGSRVAWLEHDRCFSLNPCVYPYWVTKLSLPRDDSNIGVEGILTARMRAEGLRFGVWGPRVDTPSCVHIGYERAAGWRL